MRTLVIETASAACSVALFEGARLIADIHEVVGRGHAERLVPMIGELPGQGRADAVLVDCGPGSFTGVRVGLAAARALGFAWGVAVSGYSSLVLIAAGHGDQPLAVAVHGGHGQLFVQRFAGMRPLTDLASLSPEDAAAAIPDALVLGDGAALLVAARSFGEAREGGLAARDAITLPAELRALPPSPIYGRSPDARPMAGW